MAKNAPRTGKSARRGNAKSPYAKYGKRETVYSQAYRDWKRANTVGSGTSTRR